MSKLKVTTVKVIRKMEEQAMYVPVNTIKTAFVKESDIENAGSTQEALAHKLAQQYQETLVVRTKCANYLCYLGGMLVSLLDCLINICSKEWVRNVIVVFLTVCLEVFVVMILAASTVLTTVIVNIDDAYRNRDKTNDNVEITKEEPDISNLNHFDEPVRGETDVQDLQRLDGSADVIENVATRLIKNNKTCVVSASES